MLVTSSRRIVVSLVLITVETAVKTLFSAGYATSTTTSQKTHHLACHATRDVATALVHLWKSARLAISKMATLESKAGGVGSFESCALWSRTFQTGITKMRTARSAK